MPSKNLLRRAAPPRRARLAGFGARSYNRAMRRPTRVAIALLLPPLLLFAAYSAYWRITAGRIRDGLTEWAQTARAQQVDAAWKKLHIAGYPFSFRIELTDAKIKNAALSPPPQLRAPLLTGSARPWNLRQWRLAAAKGAIGEIAGIAGRPPVSLSARQATGRVAPAADGGSTLTFELSDLTLAAASPLTARSGRLRIQLPAHPPHSYSDPEASFSASLYDTKLPAAVEPLGDTIAELDFAATIKGPVPEGPLPQVAAQWRDAGGTIDLDALHFRWGGLAAHATGTFALDRELQPIASFSGAVEGYDQIIAALVAQGSLSAKNAGLARFALKLLAKAGPDGKPQIATSFTIQNGRMYLGPAPLGKAPHIDWR
jgi:hypothetical protein